MENKPRMVFWKGKKYWVGKLIDYPEVMTQGETFAELEENIAEAYQLLVLDAAQEQPQPKERPAAWTDKNRSGAC